jgi:hypothetical protein
MEYFFRKFFSFVFGIFEPQVQVSIFENTDPKKSHGNVWVKTPNGLEMRRMVVDKPRHLKRHDADVIEGIYEQMEKMGLDVEHVEIRTRHVHRVYRHGSRRPQYDQRALPA